MFWKYHLSVGLHMRHTGAGHHTVSSPSSVINPMRCKTSQVRSSAFIAVPIDWLKIEKKQLVSHFIVSTPRAQSSMVLILSQCITSIFVPRFFGFLIQTASIGLFIYDRAAADTHAHTKLAFSRSFIHFVETNTKSEPKQKYKYEANNL